MNKYNCGIYQIRNLWNNKIYIGQSINLTQRKASHWYKLKRKMHCNTPLQSSYNKYGRKNFIFEILIFCELFELTRYEQIFVDKYKNKNVLYNICLECVDSAKGTKRTKEMLRKREIRHADKWKGRMRKREAQIRTKNCRKVLENYCQTNFGRSLDDVLKKPELDYEIKIKNDYDNHTFKVGNKRNVIREEDMSEDELYQYWLAFISLPEYWGKWLEE